MPTAEILILSDSKPEVKNLKSSLTKLGYHTAGITNNLTEALELTSALRPDLIIVDTKLNEFEDGIEAARTITAKHFIPHIFISTETDEKIIERSKTTNPYGFLLKPVDMRDLNACLRLALFRHESEIKLKESEERYFRLTENAKDMIYRISLKNYSYDYINNACEIITGYRPNEFYDRPGLLNEIVYPDNKEIYNNYISKLIEGKAPSYLEFMITNKSGELKWLNMRNVLLKESDMLEGIVTDVTEQKTYEELLTQQREEYKLIFEAIPAMVIVKDLSNKIVRINKRASEFIGSEIENMEGRNIGEFYPEQAAKYLQEDLQVINSGEPMFGIIEEIERNGEIRVLHYDKFPYYGPKGNISGVIVMARDITQEKKVEQKLHEVERKNSVLIDTIPDLLFEYDTEGRYVDFRAANRDELFKRPEEFMGRSVTEVLPGEISEDYMSCIKKAYEADEMQVYEYTLSLNGGTKDFEARFVKSGPGRVIAIIRDITSKKAADEAVRQSLKEKEILLKEIHHRVKNNLQIVTSLLKLQSKYVSDKNAVELLKESQNRVQSMSLIHQKLYQSRDFSHINFYEYILTVTIHLQHSFGILGDRVKINIDARGIIMSIDNAIPAGLIINELVSNSLKYAFPNKRKGEINIIITEDKESGDYWLSVRDNGVGVPEELNVAKAGSFGLNLVNMLVGQMGGTLEVVSNNGVEFRINFKSSEYVKRA